MRSLHNQHQHRGPAGRSPRGGFNEFGPGFGPGFERELGGLGFGPGFGGRDRPRGRRRGGRGGDVRAAVLLLLADSPRHGYQLIQDIAERSSGAWTPSPGSVYPVLSQLEDEGLITLERVEGRKTATLTPEGQTYVDANRDDLDSSWTEATEAGPEAINRETGQAVKGLMMAWSQVMKTGTPEQREQANALISSTRKGLYGILASDDQAN
ncbi:MAG TPA: PadR family transcriptional regulator [Propionibacteriaceae bacterium]